MPENPLMSAGLQQIKFLQRPTDLWKLIILKLNKIGFGGMTAKRCDGCGDVRLLRSVTTIQILFLI